jgi:flagellin
MSFRLNNNISALNAHRNLVNNNADLSRSMGRLSTGLRINSAGDDPAGLVASEFFRAQITSVDSANRNNQDAINYAKTAEGALSEVSKLLTDARALAIASGNVATLSPVQIQANQDQLNSIVQSITRISTNTQFGKRRLLDGSSGVVPQLSNTNRVAGLSLSGTIAGASVTQSGLITVTAVSPVATRGTINSAALTGGVVLAAGSFQINGVTFNVSAGTSGSDVANMINAVTGQTGVSASFNTTTNIMSMTTVNYGTNSRVTYSDAGGVLSAAGTNSSSAGTDAIAAVAFPGFAAPVLFTGGRNGLDGLSLTDADGNVLRLTEPGNVVAGYPMAIGQISVGLASFQIGANANQTALLSLPNVASSQLGSDLFAGVNLSNLSLATSSGATQALQVIDRAIEQVSFIRGRIGQFERYTLESNNRSLNIAKENMTASESAIRDVDMAAEMTMFTKTQLLQQTGMSILAQANNLPQSVVSLIRG